jgi:predicted nucleic acid-binding protein
VAADAVAQEIARHTPHLAAKRDPDDWPTLALALNLPVWSQDKDLAVAGVEVLMTGQLLDALRDAGWE